MKPPKVLDRRLGNWEAFAGVSVFELDAIVDGRGSVFYGWSRGDAQGDLLNLTHGFPRELTEVYFSSVNPNVFKGWHLHLKNDINYVCVAGALLVYLIDLRPESKTFAKATVIKLQYDDPKMLHIPRMVWNGFASAGDQGASVANFMEADYQEAEMARVHPDEFPIKIPDLKYDLAG